MASRTGGCETKKVYPEAENLRTNPRRGVIDHVPPVEIGENEEDSEGNGMQFMMQGSTQGPTDTHEEESMSETANSSHRSDHIDGLTQPSSRPNTMRNVGQKKKRKRTPMETTIERIAVTMEERNEYLERLTSRHVIQQGPSIEERMANVVAAIKAVHKLVPMSPLYWASLNLVATDETMWGVFLALPDEEKLPFLMFQTKESRNTKE